MVMAPPLYAVDFRGTTLGGACDGVETFERAARSHPLEANHGQQRYRGKYLGHDVEIGYSCHHGHLMGGRYTFWFDDFDSARKFFLAHRGDLIMLYGPPTIDQGSDGYLDYLASIGFEVKDSHRYVLLWQGDDYSITYGANPANESQKGAWVVIDIAKQH